MRILGLSAFYHDSAAALLVNGEIVAAAVAGEYDAISIWPQDVDRARAEGLDLPDIRRLI